MKPPAGSRLLVRVPNWIGDAVMSTPALGALRDHYPGSEITIAAPPAVSELFRYHPDVDHVIVFDKARTHRGIAGRLRFCRDLQARRFDIAVLLQNAIEAAIVTAIAGIPNRVGYRTDARGFLLTHGVRIGRKERRLHHTRYYVYMLERLGIQNQRSELCLALRSEDRVWVDGVLKGRDVAVINPGAAYGSAKRWYPQRFAGVADLIHRRYGMEIVLIGGLKEREIGNEIASAMRYPSTNIIGNTSVREMMAVLASSKLVVTNDSGPMHVAAAFGTPIVALFGPTDPRTTSPWSKKAVIVRKKVFCSPCLLRRCPIDHRCMKRIQVEDVMNAVDDLLKNG
ncbi:MAG: lipopolysaccharide heptosyltransferase II [Desulfobacterales bacterium]